MQQDASSDQAGSWTRSTESGATEAPFEPLIHAVIADHKLIRCIGRGAYGEVWLARHTMGMYRAVKIVHRKYFRDRHPFERELSGIRKFEPISRSHRGFIDILHVGMHEGGDYFYYVMELGDDQCVGSKIDPDTYCPKTLSRELRSRGTMDYPQGLQLGLDLSRALAELHRNGLVHRDIKPSNILFVNDVPKLADIGLVSQADQTCSYVGTEGFIPPEGPGAAQADVYALGKVLYEAITGKDRLDYPELPPDWDVRTGHEKLQELNEVILHACNDAPQRYHTAEDMHADLVVLLAGKSVRRLRSLERQISRFKRIGALALLVTAIAGAVFYLILRERSMSLQVREGRVAMLLARGNNALDSGDVAGALPYFAEAKAEDDRNSARETEHEIRLGSVIEESPKITQMMFASTGVVQVAMSRDQRKLLIVEFKGRAYVADSLTGRPITPYFGQDRGMRRGTFNSDARLVGTASEDNTACLWRANDGSKVSTFPHDDAVFSLEFSPDNRFVVTGCNDQQAWVWDIQSCMVKFKLIGHTDAVIYATFSHDGKLIATASRDYTARIWDVATGRQIGPALQHPDWVQFVAFSPDDRYLVTACEDYKARVWDVQTSQRLPPDLQHDDVVSSVGFSPDGRLIVTTALDGTARLWRADDHLPFQSVPILWHSSRVWHAVFAADGHRIISGSVDGSVRIWDLAGVAVPSALPLNAFFSKDKTRYFRASDSGLQVYNTLSQNSVPRVFGPKTNLLDCRLSDDGAFAICCLGSQNSLQQRVQVWDRQAGILAGPDVSWINGLSNLRLSQNGKLLLGFYQDKATLFNVADGKILWNWEVDGGDIRSALFNPAATAVAVWTDRVLTVFNTASRQMLFPPLTHPFSIKAVEFTRDGRKLVTGGADESFGSCYAQTFDASSGQSITPPLSHGDGVLCTRFSPIGQVLATGGEDSKTFIWDADSGKKLASIKHHAKVMDLAFGQDGKTILTANWDRTARLWSPETGRPLTPVLFHHLKLREARILGPDSIVTVDQDENVWLWRLPLECKPITDDIRLARLLSGETTIELSHSQTIIREPLAKAWEDLKSLYPSAVTVSSEQIANWYDFQAEESEIEDNPRAAIFYLEHLQALRPQDASISPRLLRAQKELQNLSN